MKDRLLIVTDLGTFKAFRVLDNPVPGSHRLELVDDFETNYKTQKMGEYLTDDFGRFAKGNHTGTHDMDDGERHNIRLEWQRRALKDLANRIHKLAWKNHVEGIFLAADNEINRPLLELIPTETREKIEKNLVCNLTKLDKAELVHRFY